MPTPPKIAHVVISLASGGLEHLVARWTHARNADFPGSTVIYCLDEAGQLADQFPVGVIHAMGAQRRRKPWDRTAVQRIRDRIAADQITILHSHNMTAQQYAAIACFRTPVRHIYTQHGANLHHHSWKDRIRSRLLTYVTDQIVAVSQGTADSMTSCQGIPHGRIKVVTNGIDPHPSTPVEETAERRAALGIPKDACVFGSVGRLAPVKAWDRFLPVFLQLVQSETQCNPVKLLLVGDGESRQALEKQADGLGLAEHVVFAGHQTAPRPFLDVMDVFILPSHSEGLSVALLEAMAAGLPVIATAVGENPRLITPDRTGLILVENPDEWPDQLSGFIADRASLRSCGDRGRTFVLANYRTDTTLAAYEKLYQTLCPV